MLPGRVFIPGQCLWKLARFLLLSAEGGHRLRVLAPSPARLWKCRAVYCPRKEACTRFSWRSSPLPQFPSHKRRSQQSVLYHDAH